MCRKLWTSKEISILKENYFESSKEELQCLLPNRTWKAIVKKARVLKLKRTDDITIRKSNIYKMIDGAIYKMCPNCKRVSLLDKYHFFVDKTAKTGFKSRCKECEIKDYRFGDKIGLFNIRWSEIYCMSGIYKITNKTTGKIYIGSASNFCVRWSTHYNMLIKNNHENEYLQNAWNKYGKDDFIFEIIEYVEDKNKLLAREQYWLDFTKCYDRTIGFNIEAIAGSSYGRITSEKTKEKLKVIKNKPVKQFDCKGTYIREWISAREINRVLGSGYSRGGIQCCCSHKTV